MNDKSKQSYAQDGLTLSESTLNRLAHPELKKGLTISSSAITAIANQQTQVSKPESTPAPAASGTVKTE